MMKLLCIPILATAIVASRSPAGDMTAYAAAKETKQQTTCPVMGNPIDKSVYVDYKGKRIYFCCKSCVQTFTRDPEKYIKKLETSGVTPENSPKASGK